MKTKLCSLKYWKKRCWLAERCLEESPCDPDITKDQIEAWKKYNEFIKDYEEEKEPTP